jgi:hypothetical protein
VMVLRNSKKYGQHSIISSWKMFLFLMKPKNQEMKKKKKKEKWRRRKLIRRENIFSRRVQKDKLVGKVIEN